MKKLTLFLMESLALAGVIALVFGGVGYIEIRPDIWQVWLTGIAVSGIGAVIMVWASARINPRLDPYHPYRYLEVRPLVQKPVYNPIVIR